MIDLSRYEVWFLVGSQNLYGPAVLEQVASHAQTVVQALNDAPAIPVRVVYRPVLTTPEEMLAVVQAANAAPECVGVVTWMHTFSPAKNWIAALQALQKPQAHLHTQFNRDLPFAEIDMDFMNLNQSAHGDREYGFMVSRLRLNRKVIVGHWQDPLVIEELAAWARVACGWHASQHMKVARLGDNMRYVAVTEGDKVEAQMRFGYQVNGYGVGDVVQYIDAVTPAEITALVEEYAASYTMAPDLLPGGAAYQAVRDAAQIEVGLRRFLEEGGFTAFTDTFENLHGSKQLPGIATQRLMADGYGFGAEGDWKTAALVRTMKVMAAGLPGGTSFMEDYTYHLDPAGMRVLGAHMLEICPSIARNKPSLEVHPLSIGGKEDPARLVFNTKPGPALVVSVLDMGNRFRMLVNTLDVVESTPMPHLPVAHALWRPHPNLKVAAAAWIYAGGAHHASFSQALTAEHLQDFAEIAGIEYLLIDEKTDLRTFKNEIRWNEAAYRLGR